MSRGGEISFEVVSDTSGLTIHVEDHGQPVATHGARCSVSTTGKPARSASLLPGEPNTFVVKGFNLQKGDRLLLTVEFPNGTATGAVVDVP